MVLLDEEGLRVIVMVLCLQNWVLISPVGLPGQQQIEEYRVQFTLGGDFLTALLPISGWGEDKISSRHMDYSFLLPKDLSASAVLDMGLALKNKNG